MTDEELDKARADEAYRLTGCPYHVYFGETVANLVATAARLAREGWVPVDPFLVEARESVAKVYDSLSKRKLAKRYRDGLHDGCTVSKVALIALKRGIENREGREL